MIRAFSARFNFLPPTYGVAIGWYDDGPLALGFLLLGQRPIPYQRGAAPHVMDKIRRSAESADE